MEKLLIFDQNHGLTLLKNIPIFLTFLTCYFYSLEGLFSLSRTFSNTFLLAYFADNIKMEKLPVFDQNNRPTPLEKSQVFVLFNFLFL